MQIVIDIPKEFEEHFKTDKFEDSLARVASDIKSFGFNLSGRYEQETITMLRKAFKSGIPLPKGHGRLIDADELKRTMEKDKRRALSFVDLTDFVWLAPTIIEADKGGKRMKIEENKNQIIHDVFNKTNTRCI